MSRLQLREFVIDASVMAKWVLAEPGSETASHILELILDNRMIAIAPPFAIVEVGNVLAKRVRRGELAALQASRAFDFLCVQAPKIYCPPGLYESALGLALAHQQALYDCVYLALALSRHCDLITADQRFHAGMARTFPAIRLLSSLPDLD